MQAGQRIKQKGAVLLMTLSVILLLSVALMKTFENRSIEMAHLENISSTFKARMAARSGFRILLQIIQDKSLFGVTQVLSTMPESFSIEMPGLEGELSGIKIEPIDHKFNLYWTFRSSSIDESSYTLSIFTNLVNQIYLDRTNKSSSSIELSKEEIAPVMADIFDWQDPNEDPDVVNEEYGTEQYPQQEGFYKIKNKNFDILSELKLIPKFQNLKLTSTEIRKNFKIIQPSEKSFINVNIATKDEIVEFLKRFEDVDGYQSLFQSENLPKLLSSELGIARKYENYENLFNVLNQELSGSDAIGTKNKPTFFKIKSEYISIQYKVHIKKTTLRVRSIVELKYKSETSFDISGFTIHQFRVI